MMPRLCDNVCKYKYAHATRKNAHCGRKVGGKRVGEREGGSERGERE